MGKIYDFRCYFCKVLPRVGSANRFGILNFRPSSSSIIILHPPRSELYRHYSVQHYTAELKCEFGNFTTKCPICKKDLKNTGYISHIGQVHDEVGRGVLEQDTKHPRFTNISPSVPRSPGQSRARASPGVPGGGRCSSGRG